MKRLIAFALVLATLICLIACGEEKKDSKETDEEINEDWEPYSKEYYQMKIDEASALVGVSYLGFYDDTASTLIEFVNKQKYWSELILLENIPESNLVDGKGYELYLILPAEGASVTVYEAVFSESEADLKKGKELYKSEKGEPFFVKGNESEIVPTFIIVAEKDGKSVEYSPCLSMKDGKVNVNTEQVYDMTPYDSMTDFIYSE